MVQTVRDAAEPREQAVLISGVYGSGKSAVAAEIAHLLEERRLPYAAMDLDWLGWFYTGDGDPSEHAREYNLSGDEVRLANVAAVVGNYRSAGVRYLVLAGALGWRAELEGLQRAVSMPMRVVRLEVPLAEIERRLAPDPTAGRVGDLRVAREWIESERGVGLEDVTVDGDRPIREVALKILHILIS
ncbi:MAG: hypothetical protein M3295_06840 [Chloroflexota bacterium]|nr:hypothetical protein [Chloroflexota bacterium]